MAFCEVSVRCPEIHPPPGKHSGKAQALSGPLWVKGDRGFKVERVEGVQELRVEGCWG